MTLELTSYGQRLADQAHLHPEKIALSFYPRQGEVTRYNWRALDAQVNQAARVLAARGVIARDIVGFSLKNSPLHIILTLAIWRLGATTFNYDPILPAQTVSTLLARAGAKLTISEVNRTAFETDMALASDQPLPNLISHPGKILMSGGSTGIPKIMAEDRAYLRSPGASWGKVAPALGFYPNQVQLMAASLSHNAGLTWAQNGLFEGQHLVLFEKFDADRMLDVMDSEKVEFVLTVTTMVVRLLDAYKKRPRGLSKLSAFYHTAGPCPIWLKQEWIDILGADKVFEMYGSGENTGQTVITGGEWLSHKGSVGRGFETEILICDNDLNILPPHELGEVFMLPEDIAGRSHYLGADAPQPRRLPSGHQSVGDMGWLDEEGYLYLSGRRDDVINCGGLKIHPEAIEAALLRCPQVADAVCYGLPHREWGEVPLAEVVLQAGATLEALQIELSDHLSKHDLPREILTRDRLARDDFGKIRRRAIRAAQIEARGL